MNRQHILAEISRTAASNGGVALGRGRFEQETGIKESDWLGKYWARWSDAVQEAGCTPSQMQPPIDEHALLEVLALLVRELGHWPVVAELKLRARQIPKFPSHNTFRKFGNRDQQIARLASFCSERPTHADVVTLLPATRQGAPTPHEAEADDVLPIGFVYLLKAAKYFKIGRSSSFERRSRELAIQLPERAETIHVIRTDDPAGIEFYWHRRFAEKRKNGEWFDLSAQDIKAFKRRKFM